MMEAHHIELVRRTFSDVFADGSDATDLYYDRLFVLAPSLRRLFDDDLSLQKSVLVETLEDTLTVLDDTPALRARMSGLGARHAEYGTMPEAYSLMGAALLHTVKTRLGPQYSDEVEQAWTNVYAAIAAEMQSGAA